MATTGRDEMGRFTSHVKAKGDEAMKNVMTKTTERMPKAAGDSAPYEGKETMAEEEVEHGVALKAPLESHKGKETPEEEANEEREISKKYGAQKGKHKPWGMEKSKGW